MMKIKRLFYVAMILIFASSSPLWAQSLKKAQQQEHVDGSFYRSYLLTFPSQPKNVTFQIEKEVSENTATYWLSFTHMQRFQSYTPLLLNILEAIEIENEAGIQRFDIDTDQFFRDINNNVYRQSIRIPLDDATVEGWSQGEWLRYRLYLRTQDPHVVEIKDKGWLKMQMNLQKLIDSSKV